MISFAKIIGDLIGGYYIHIGGAIGAYLVATEAAHTLGAITAPVSKALGG